MLKLLAFASMALVAASPAAATQSTKTTIMLVTVSSTSGQYVLGDPVTLTFVFKNDGKAVIHMNGWLRPEMLFSLQITDANGDAVAPSGPPRNHMMGITLFPLRA